MAVYSAMNAFMHGNARDVNDLAYSSSVQPANPPFTGTWIVMNHSHSVSKFPTDS
jgi:hypothetical protein